MLGNLYSMWNYSNSIVMSQNCIILLVKHAGTFVYRNLLTIIRIFISGSVSSLHYYSVCYPYHISLLSSHAMGVWVSWHQFFHLYYCMLCCFLSMCFSDSALIWKIFKVFLILYVAFKLPGRCYKVSTRIVIVTNDIDYV